MNQQTLYYLVVAVFLDGIINKNTFQKKCFAVKKNTVSTIGLATIWRGARDWLIFDPYLKKKQHKELSSGIQTTLTCNLSLC